MKTIKNSILWILVLALAALMPLGALAEATADMGQPPEGMGQPPEGMGNPPEGGDFPGEPRRPKGADLLQLVRHEGLPAEPRLHRHDKEHVGKAEIRLKNLYVRMRFYRDTRFFSARVDLLHSLCKRNARFLVNSDDICACINELVDVSFRRLYHKVYIQYLIRCRSNG